MHPQHHPSNPPVPWQRRNSLFLVALTSEMQEEEWKNAKRLDVYSCMSPLFCFSKATAYWSGIPPNEGRIHVVPSTPIHLLKEEGGSDPSDEEYGIKVVLFSVSDKNLLSDGIRSRGVSKSKIEVLLCEKAYDRSSPSVPPLLEEGDDEDLAIAIGGITTAIIDRMGHENTINDSISSVFLKLDSECERKLSMV